MSASSSTDLGGSPGATELEALLRLIDIKIASGKPARTIHGRNGTR